MQKFKKGFTLAEVLITLLIIGVIASIVVPGLISNTNEAEYNVGVKKAYSDLSNATKMVQTNNGGVIRVGVGNTAQGYKDFRDDYCSVMSCTMTGTGTVLWGGINYKQYKVQSTYNPWGGVDSSAVLSNGFLLYFHSDDNCTNAGVINRCGEIFVDINGQKGPNMWGKDVYDFNVTRQNGNGVYLVLPAGVQGDTSNPATSCIAGQGYGCAAVRLTTPELMQ